MSQQLSWSDWLVLNLARNCAPDELREELLKNGFSEEQADDKMQSASELFQKNQRNLTAKDNNFIVTQSVNLPNAVKISNDKVEMYTVDGFITAEENMQLIELIRNNRRSSTTTDEGVSSFRTSTTCELASLDHPIVEEIDERICRYMGIDSSHSEPIEGQWYEVGQEFKPHTDYFEPGSKSYHHHIGDLGQRTWTFMIYLNTTAEGGSTYFGELGLNVEPVAGTALLWNNVDSNGHLNSATMHCGMPVKSGYKAVVTKWFRSVDNKPVYHKEDNELIPPLTKHGFLVKTIPEVLYNTLIEFYHGTRNSSILESIPENVSNEAGDPCTVLIELSDELRQSIHETLQPMLEAWVGNYLEPTFLHGIREYRSGAILDEHRDRIKTHVVSVILNIDQEVDSDWPLVIDDHYYRRHNVQLKPGEMVFYEGARLKHGRPSALRGRRYANVFVQFKIA